MRKSAPLFFALTLMSATAFASSLKAEPDCTKNPDLFLSINGGLPSSTLITEVAGYSAINNQQVGNFDDAVANPGNTKDLNGTYGNVACMKKAGVNSIEIAITKLGVDHQSPKNVDCKITVTNIAPGRINKYIHWNSVLNKYICVGG